jgi:signal transduction histidine kinase
LPASYALIALLAALSLGSMMLLVLRSYYADQERQYLEGNAITLQPLIAEILQTNLPRNLLQDQVNGLSFLSQSQIRLLDRNGNVIADSGVPNRKQVVAVSAGVPMQGDVMFSLPVNPPVERRPIFIYKSEQSFPSPQVVPFEKHIVGGESGDIILSVNASPYGYGFFAKAEFDPERRSSENVSVRLFGSGGNELGTLEFSNGPSYGADVIDSVTLAWLIASIFAIAIAALTGWFMSRRVTSPVLALENATHQMEQGNLSVRVDLQNEKQQEFLSLARSFNGMAEQVEQTVSTLREFVADAAHELHTPLTALQANIELARDAGNGSERTRYLARAHEQGQRLEAMVESLLKLSRIEAAASRSSFAPVDFTQLVREAGEQFASRAEQMDRSFIMNLANEEIKTLGVEMQLKQVVMNLLENALKFTPVNGKISLDLERSDHELLLTVTDSGIGIPQEDLSHLFERFHRGRNASEYPGNGLGLAIVKAIVDSHSGQVEAHSEGRGAGSRFVMRLPIA